MSDALKTLVAEELAEPVEPQVAQMAAAIASLYPQAARALLFYGSCLRSRELDGQMLDFYLIVSSYDAAYGRRWMAAANRLIPPNVFPFEHDGLAAKYAVLSEADFHRLNGPETNSVSVWARFSQPARLVWAADDRARAAAVDAVARAAPTLIAAAQPMIGPVDDPLDLWRGAFALTYSAELRAERQGRATSVVDSWPERFRRFTPLALAAAETLPKESREQAERHWKRRVRLGKQLTVLRLAKASFTFAGGIDYLAWKINRHAGTAIRIKPWQRRWPLIGAVTLLPRLLRTRAVR